MLRVAIVKTAALGDVLRTTAILPALHRDLGAVEITWVTSPEALQLLEGNRFISHICFPEKSVTNAAFDWVISLDEELIPVRIASSLHCRRFSGVYLDDRGALGYTQDLAGWFGMGLLRSEQEGGLSKANELKRRNTEAYAELLYQGLGLSTPVERPQMVLDPTSVARMRSWLLRHCADPGSQKVGVNSAAGQRWKFKSLSIQKTVEVIVELLTDPSVTVVLLGGSAELERNFDIARKVNSKALVCAPCDLPLTEFAALIACCDALLSSDSLALHLGVALSVPTVAFFGPTSAAEVGLFGLGEKLVTSLPCRGCYLAQCNVVPNCMEIFDTSTLAEAVRAQLKRNRTDFSR
jgi:heptosyltransferase II